MDFELSEEHRLIRETVRRVAREVVAPRAAEIGETDEYPQDIFEAFRELGLLGLTMPEQYGGSGAGVDGRRDRHRGGGEVLLRLRTDHHALDPGHAPDPDRRHGGAEAALGGAGGSRASYARSFSLSEPSVGSDAAGLQAYAVRDGDSYVLNGEKNYVSGGTQADYCVVFAKTDRAAGGRGISAFIVPTDTPGYTIARVNPKMGVKGMQIANFALEDVRVPAENLVGGVEGRGLNHALLALNCVRPLVGARGLGLAEGALHYALEYRAQPQGVRRADHGLSGDPVHVRGHGDPD